MIVLDSDHLSVLKYQESPLCLRLVRRMETSPDQDFATTIVCVEEQMRGWLALIHRRREALEQVRRYLFCVFEKIDDFTIVPVTAFETRRRGE